MTSAVEGWIDVLPEGWYLIPAKAAFAERREPNWPDDVHLTPSQVHGVLPQADYIARTGKSVVQNLQGQDNMKHVEPDDFIIHLRSFQGGIERSKYSGKVSTAYTVLKPSDRVVPSYFRWLLKSNGYIQELRTTTNQLRDGQSIKFADFAKVQLPCPSRSEQRVIADYLDRETTRIDTLIEEQQRLIEMLRERRRSVASDLFGDRVGKGTRLKWSFDELDRRAGVEADTLPLMSVSISWGVRRRDEVIQDESRAESLSNYKVCRQGDLVINRMRAFQGALGLAQEDGLVSPDYAVIRARPEVDCEWLTAVMKSEAFVSEMRQRVKGIGSADLGSARTPRINISDLGEIRIDLPEVEQQMIEVGQLHAQIAKIDALLVETERFIEFALERRAALITAAVTGQIDVREMV